MSKSGALVLVYSSFPTILVYSTERGIRSPPVSCPVNLLMHLYLNVCWRGREIRRETEVETVKKTRSWSCQSCVCVFGAGLGSTAGSSGGSLEGVGCVWGCGAWVRCRSGWECGCSAGGRRDSGRIRSPGHWVPEEHSLSVLRKKVGER